MSKTAPPQPKDQVSPPTTTVFVSYSRRDLAFVDRLDAGLREQGIEPLIDRSEIFAFEDWWRRIEGLIGQADAIIFVISPASVVSDICLREIEYAEKLSKRLAPVVARAVDAAEVPPALARLNFVFLDDDANFTSGLERYPDPPRKGGAVAGGTEAGARHRPQDPGDTVRTVQANSSRR